MLFLIPSALIVIGIVNECSAACSRRGVECIEYQVVGRYQGYEERQLPATTWVSTSTEGSSLTEANREMYKRLFSYVQGNNNRGIKVNTTTPVRTRIVPCHGATCASVFIMSFLIPSEQSDNAPYPLDPLLFIEKDPPLRFAVRIFEGRPTEIDWLEQSHALASLVKKDPTIDKSYYYTVWYDPPYQLFHRLNEIWMVKKTEKPATSNTEKGQLMSVETKDNKEKL